MTQLLDPVEARIVAILESARGSSGLGADAAARYFPSGRWRRSTYAAPLTDPGYPSGDFDRSYDIEWTGLGEEPDPQNALDPTQFREFSFSLNVGFAYGKEVPQFISTTGSEVAATAATLPRKRALSEMDRALKALTFPAIFEDTALMTGVALFELVRAKGTKVTLQDLGGGRMIATAQMEVTLEVATGTNYDP